MNGSGTHRSELRTHAPRGLSAPAAQPAALGRAMESDVLYDESSADGSSLALAAQAEALVRARCALARRFPRDADVVRQRLLRDCERFGFADAAIYQKPVGTKWNRDARREEEQFIEGASVRFAEALMRHMGNLLVQAVVVADDERYRTVRVSVMDLETNATGERDVTVAKTIERRSDRGRQVVAERRNTYGDVVYVCLATDEELQSKANAAVSKARRNLILEMAPADIVEEALSRCQETFSRGIRADPDSYKRTVIDAFGRLGVTALDLKDYLGHELEKVSPAELEDLRRIYEAVKSQETNWAAVVDSRRGTRTLEPPTPLAAQTAAEPPTAPPTPEPSRPVTPEAATGPFFAVPAEGTDAYADWLVSQMAAARDEKALSALRLSAAKVPGARSGEIGQAFLRRSKELRARPAGGAR